MIQCASLILFYPTQTWKFYICFNFYYSGPVTSIFEDGHYILYNYLLQQKTHNNDFSVRFRTAQDNAVLFQTYSTRGLNEYIRAVLENGRVKVTFRINGVDQVRAQFKLLETIFILVNLCQVISRSLERIISVQVLSS